MADHYACAHGAVPPPTKTQMKAALNKAEIRSLNRGFRWTEPRRRVYELLVQSGAPMKAYDLMEVYQEGRAAKPPTVYRALEFLEESGLVHRIASLNAYLACDGDDPSHAAAFLICDCCGSAEEFEPGAVRTASTAAKKYGFQARAIALEVRGKCQRCH